MMNNLYMDDFEIQDKMGRDKATQLFPKLALVEATEKYSHWDMSGCTSNLSDDKNFFIEIKNRDVVSTEYPTIYMEFEKYQNLISISEKYYADAFYLSFFTDDKAYIFNVSKMKITDLKLVVKKCKKTTFGDTVLVDKIFIELNKQNGKKYNKVKH